MKAIFLALAILLSAGAAFFSFSERNKIQEVITSRLDDENENQAVSARISKAEKEITAEKEKIAAVNTRKEEISQSVSALKSAGSAAKRDLATLDAEIQTQEAEIQELNKMIAELTGLVKSIGDDVTIDNLPSKIQEMQETKTAKTKELEETKTLAEAASKAATESRAEKDRLMKRKMERTAAIRGNATEAVITAVNPEWGFVVVGAGKNSGFQPQSPLLVERDGRYIGKVIPSSVESTQTIAEIDQASFAIGVRIQPGDRVIVGRPAN